MVAKLGKVKAKGKPGRPRKDEVSVKEKFLETYEKLNCQLVTTCRALNLAPNTIRNWRALREFKDGVELENSFDRAMTELEQMQAEKVEGNLVDSALDKARPNTVAQIFYLKNNWKEKYGEHQIVEHRPSQLWFEKTNPTKQLEGGEEDI